jgi:hypothetical protein
MAFAWMLRTGDTEIPEFTPEILQECLDHFYFIGVDPSGLRLMTQMKKNWEEAGRPSTHYYQGFREVRWESVKKVIAKFDPGIQKRVDQTSSEVIKDMMEMLVMRDGFQIGGAANYVIENWENMRHACEELRAEGEAFKEDLDDRDLKRLLNPEQKIYDKWIENKHYSPDRAERFRAAARNEIYRVDQGKAGVKL